MSVQRMGDHGFGRYVPYLIKSAAIVVLLLVLSRTLPTMPTWAVAIALAILSLIPAIGSIYRVVVNRTFNQKKFGEGSVHKGNYSLRVPLFIGFYVLSAISIASILLESPTWGAGMWATVFLSVPLYIVTSAVSGWIVEKKEKAIPLVKDARAARISVFATGALLCVMFTTISFLQPVGPYDLAIDAFMAAPKPFEESPSFLMREIGDLTALVGGLKSYALMRLSETSRYGYVFLQVLLNAASMFGVAGMLSVCFVDSHELKRVFLVLEKDGSRGSERTFVKSFCVVFAMLPILLSAGIVCLDTIAQDPAQNEGYTFAKKIIRDQISLAVYEMDGKYYDPEAVEEILERAREKSKGIAREAEEALIPLVNATFDTRVANIDSYLDWYYGLFTDWEVLLHMVTDSAEEFAKQQLQAKIEEGVDNSELYSKFEQYLKQAADLQSSTLEELSKYELKSDSNNDYPDWLVYKAEPMDVALKQSLEPLQSFLEAAERVGIGSASDEPAGAIAKKVAEAIATKPVFETITSRIAGLAAARVGGIAAFPTAIVAIFGANLATVKAEELMHREEYKQELESAINEQREETLTAVRRAIAATELT